MLLIGSDCPALTSEHLRTAADILRDRAPAVVIPAEDGGYALIGVRTPEPALFSDMPWSTPVVMNETRRRLRTLGLTWQEPVTLWDVDLPQDLERLRTIGLHDLIPSEGHEHAPQAQPRVRDLVQDRRIKVNPPTIISAAATRLARNGSLRKTTAIAAPNSTLLSRSAATIAIGATVIAQIAIP